MPGTKVSAEAWIKTAVTPGPGAQIRLVFWKYLTYVPTETWAPYLNGTTDWRRQQIEGVCPPDADTVQFALEFSGAGQVWFDDADITVPPWGEVTPPELHSLVAGALCLTSPSALDAAAFPEGSKMNFMAPWGDPFQLDGSAGIAGKSTAENAGRKRQRWPVENDSTWVGC